MTTPRKRGWCPTLYDPMDTGDGLLLRVKPPHARLTAIQADALAAAADKYGNGLIELTQRGNLQIRGLTANTTAPFATAMVEAGLADPDPATERRRAVMPPPLLGDDPTMDPRAAALTAALEHACATDPRLAALPAKFAIHIDAGGIFAGRPAAATLIAHPDGTLHPGTRDTASTPAGPLPYPGTERMAFALAPPFGQLDAAMLHRAAALAEAHGTTLRITPWRAILLGSVPCTTTIDAGPAWITAAADPRLQITTCIGAPGCRSGSTPTRTDAARLAVALHPAQTLHLSGCAKGCAHPGPAPLTLVGRDGRYDIVHHGRAADAPVTSGIALPLSMAGLGILLHPPEGPISRSPAS
jgi:precorrin-3B synthase